VGKYFAVLEGTDDNTIKHMRFTRTISKATTTHLLNTYYFPMATAVPRTRLNITSTLSVLIVLLYLFYVTLYSADFLSVSYTTGFYGFVSQPGN
jgi:hypothetical protein